MPCLLGCGALLFPRLIIVLMVIFSDYLGQAYQTTLWPLLGFFFMPLTTLAYAWAWHSGGGSVAGVGLAIVIIAAIIDLGLMSGSASHKKVRKYYVVKRPK